MKKSKSRFAVRHPSISGTPLDPYTTKVPILLKDKTTVTAVRNDGRWSIEGRSEMPTARKFDQLIAELNAAGFTHTGAKAKFSMPTMSELKIKAGRNEDEKTFTATVNGNPIQGVLNKGWSRLGGWGWEAKIEGVTTTGGSQMFSSMRRAVEQAVSRMQFARNGAKAKFGSDSKTKKIKDRYETLRFLKTEKLESLYSSTFNSRKILTNPKRLTQKDKDLMAYAIAVYENKEQNVDSQDTKASSNNHDVSYVLTAYSRVGAKSTHAVNPFNLPAKPEDWNGKTITLNGKQIKVERTTGDDYDLFDLSSGKRVKSVVKAQLDDAWRRGKIRDIFSRTGKTSMAQSDFKVGDQVHLGFAQKGGTGFDGIITKIEGTTVYIKSPEEGQFGARTWKGPLSLLTHGWAGYHADQHSRTGKTSMAQSEMFSIEQPAYDDSWRTSKKTPLVDGYTAKERKAAMDAYRFAVSQEDRYLGSVFVTPSGQREYEEATRAAYLKAKKLNPNYQGFSRVGSKVNMNKLTNHLQKISASLGFKPSSITMEDGVAKINFSQRDGSSGRLGVSLRKPLLDAGVTSDAITATADQVCVNFSKGAKAKFGSDVILEDIGDDQVRATARVEGRSAGSFDGPRSQSAQLLLKALKIAGQGHEVSSGVYDMTHITLNDAAKRAMPKSAMMSRVGSKAKFSVEQEISNAEDKMYDGDDDAPIMISELVRRVNRKEITGELANRVRKLVKEARAYDMYSRTGAKAAFGEWENLRASFLRFMDRALSAAVKGDITLAEDCYRQGTRMMSAHPALNEAGSSTRERWMYVGDRMRKAKASRTGAKAEFASRPVDASMWSDVRRSFDSEHDAEAWLQRQGWKRNRVLSDGDIEYAKNGAIAYVYTDELMEARVRMKGGMTYSSRASRTGAKAMNATRKPKPYEAVYYKWFDGVEVGIMDMGKIAKEIEAALASGANLDSVMPQMVQKYRKN